MAFCIKCGAPHGPASQFCQGCGSALAQPNAGTSPAVAPAPYSSAVANPPAPMPITKRKGKALKIIGIIVAVFFALVVWGALTDAGKNGGKRADESTAGSGSTAAPATSSVISEEQEKDGQLMCGEIQGQLAAYLKGAIKGIECHPAAEDGGKIALAVGFPIPILAKDDLVRKNTLFMTFTFAGSAISQHTNTAVKKVYALDTSRTSFAVPGEFAKGIYTRMMNSELTEQDAKEEVARTAERVKIPEKVH